MNAIYRVTAVILAAVSWLIPLGLHRVMMRQKFWWMHPIAFLIATVACILFYFGTPANAEFARVCVERGTTMAFGDFVRGWDRSWLLIGVGAWMLLVMHDAVMVFFWSLPNKQVEPSNG